MTERDTHNSDTCMNIKLRMVSRCSVVFITPPAELVLTVLLWVWERFPSRIFYSNEKPPKIYVSGRNLFGFKFPNKIHPIVFVKNYRYPMRFYNFTPTGWLCYTFGRLPKVPIFIHSIHLYDSCCGLAIKFNLPLFTT